MAGLQVERVELQEWIRHANLKIVVIFEGRDAAGKGGSIKRVCAYDIKHAPRYVVNGDSKKRARLNVIKHLLSLIPYEHLSPPQMGLPPRQDTGG